MQPLFDRMDVLEAELLDLRLVFLLADERHLFGDDGLRRRVEMIGVQVGNDYRIAYSELNLPPVPKLAVHSFQ
jgi:hypothetical protein